MNPKYVTLPCISRDSFALILVGSGTCQRSVESLDSVQRSCFDLGCSPKQSQELTVFSLTLRVELFLTQQHSFSWIQTLKRHTHCVSTLTLIIYLLNGNENAFGLVCLHMDKLQYSAILHTNTFVRRCFNECAIFKKQKKKKTHTHTDMDHCNPNPFVC